MKIDAPVNNNYAATVVRLPHLVPLEGADNLVGAPIYGFQAIVDKSHHEGDLGIFFPAEVQLSDAFCANNGLFRHSDLNKDQTQKGYLEDNRRVRAIKLRGHRSDALFMPIESLSYVGNFSIYTLEEGDVFDTLAGQEICRKYIIPHKGTGTGTPKSEKKFLRVDPRLFPEHDDTDNYFRNSHLIPDDAYVYITQKVHGTSWRGSRSLVQRKLSIRDRIAKKLGVKVLEQEWDTVAGSRKVIKDPHNPAQEHYYGSDLWTDYLSKVEDLIPEGFIVYGEIIGWTKEGGAIQENYTYNQVHGEHELFVYRVATVNPRGVLIDLSWPQVRLFCEERDLKHVPDLMEGTHSELVAMGYPTNLLDKKLAADGWKNALLLSNAKTVDEGVCIRMDGLRPTILKAKSPIFLQHETSLLDKDVVDLETLANEEV